MNLAHEESRGGENAILALEEAYGAAARTGR
jgi:hypothetical protein